MKFWSFSTEIFEIFQILEKLKFLKFFELWNFEIEIYKLFWNS